MPRRHLYAPSLIVLGILLVLPFSNANQPAWADDLDEATASRTVRTLLESDPGIDLRKIWKLSESLSSGGRPAISPLRKEAKAANPQQRLAIARALVLLEDYTKGLEELKGLVQSEPAAIELKLAALTIIGEEGELEEAEWLEDKIDTTLEPRVKLGMAKALWTLNKSNKGKGKEVLLLFLNSTDPDLRAEGALALGEIGVAEAKPVLDELRREPTPQGRLAHLLLDIMRRDEVDEQRLRTPPPVAPANPKPASGASPWKTLDEVHRLLKRYYLHDDRLDPKKLSDAAAAGFTEALDPYTLYMSPSTNAKLMESLDPSYGGVGAYVFNDVDNGSHFTISRPIFGGPVYRADLRADDIVTAIDGQSTEGLSVEECVRRLKGPPGTKVVVSILRRGWLKAREFELTRARITIPTTAYDVLPGKIGFLQILHFSEETSREVGEILDKFEKTGVEGLVIDLRYNGGGFLKSAVEIASNFVPRGKIIVSERGRPGVYDGEVHRSLGSGTHRRQVPITVLINQGTASAAEILAGALRDHDVARLVGSMTYGKGSAQIHLPLKSRPGETFTDEKRTSSSPRAGDTFDDLNGNRRWDEGEPFTSTPRRNGRYDPPEKFVDKNGNGVYDRGESFTDANKNGKWDDGEDYEDANGNGRWDPGGALKLTIAAYYTPEGFNPRREVKVVDGKVKVVGGIEPHLEAKPNGLDFWEVQAQRKLESTGRVKEYVRQLFESDLELMRRLSRSDRRDPSVYPGFDAFYDGLDTKLDKEPVRWLVRWNARRALGDRLGRELVGDIIDDPALQVALKDLFRTLGKDLSKNQDLKFLAVETK